MASPLCTINSLSTVDGVDVAASSTITIALDDVSGVTVWDLQVISTDELQDAATLTAALSINQIAKTATLVMPSSACHLRFQSQVNNGRDSAGRDDASLTTTFSVNVLLDSGRRVLAFDESLENNQEFGWVSTLNSHFRALDDVSPNVEPSGDTTGTTDSAAMAAQLAATNELRLEDGAIYYIDTRLDLTSGAQLNLGTAEIRLGSNWNSAGGTDDRTNSVFRISGTTSGSVATTLAATEPQGSSAILLTSGTGVSVGQWLRVYGQNLTVGINTIVDSVHCSELVKVASISGSPSITLDGVTYYHADIGHSVQSYAPVESVSISGGYLNTNGEIAAVGIELTNSVNVSIKDTKFRGFTRTAVDMSGCKFVSCQGLINRGQCNGFVFGSTSHAVDLDKMTASGEFDRYHSSGVARHQFWIINHCVDFAVTNVSLRKVCAVAAIWGGLNCGLNGGSAVDVDCAQIVTTAVAAERSSGMVGILFEGGNGPINDYTCFGRGVYMRNWSIVGAHQPSLNSQKIIYAHDHYNATLDSISVLNAGQNPLDAGGYLGGMLVSDFTGLITNINMKGTYRALETNNVISAVMLDNFTAEAYGGAGTYGTQYGMYFDHSATGSSLQVGHVRLINYQGIMQFGTSFTVDPDYTWHWDTLRLDTEVFKQIVPVRSNSTVVRGTVGHLQDPTATTYDAVIEATGPNAKQCVFLGAVTNNWTLAALGDATALHTGTAAKRSDFLVADASGNLVVTTNAANTNSTVYLCRRPSASGRVYAVRLACVPPFDALTAVTQIVAPIVSSPTGDLSLSCAAGSSVIIKENSTTVLTMADVANVSTLTGGGSGGTLLTAGTGDLTLSSASGGNVVIKEGSTSVLSIADLSNVSTISGQGSGGTTLTAATGNLTLNAPSGSQVNIAENGTGIISIKEAGGYGEINFTAGVGVISSQVASISGSTYVSVQSPFGRYAAFFDPTNSSIYAGLSTDTTTATGYIGNVWNGTGGSRKFENRYSRIQTTDGSVNVVAWTSPTLTNGVMHHVEAVVIGNTNGASGATYRVSGSYRTSGGTTTLIGAVATSHSGENVAGWNCTLGVSGATVRVLVTGAAATNINWECYVNVYYGASYA